jgi:competence protein ComEC
VSYVIAPDAFEEDCSRTALVVTARVAPPACTATIIDRQTSRSYGAVALRRNGDAWEVTAARPPGQDRPWARAKAQPAEAVPSAPVTRTQPRDATPRPEDLEPGD